MISWLSDWPEQPFQVVDGSLVFADISGFTALSERLSRQGRVGAEILADTISASFTRLLAAAYANGGSLLKFGGDALLLLFTRHGHVERACDAAVGMRRELRGFGVLGEAGSKLRLRMSVGVHTGPVHLFLVGEHYRELVVTGPTASHVVRMESAADKGEILLSPPAAAALPASCLGDAKGGGRLLRRAPSAPLWRPAAEPELAATTLELGLPAWLCRRAQVQDDPQHRRVTVAFLKFTGTDQLLVDGGPAAAAAALSSLMTAAQEAAEQHHVTLLASDVDKDGGKLIIVGGAPHATGDDEQAVLCAARQLIEQQHGLEIRIGVNTGPAFAGDVGPPYRRTFTVMGDTVNVAARVMAQAEPSTVLATEAVVRGSRLQFVTTPVPAFHVKGKAQALDAVVVGPPDRREVSDAAATLPLIGRDDELSTLLATWEEVVAGRGCVAVVTGDAGIGKSRLLVEVVERLVTPPLLVRCGQYSANTAYAAVRQLLRQLLGAADADDDSLRRHLAEALRGAPEETRAYAPLLGLVLGIEMPSTQEVEDLDERFRRDRLEQVVVDFVRLLVVGPASLVIEDAHWIDDASAHLLDQLFADVSGLPLLTLIARRPGPRRWPSGNAVEVDLQPLHTNASTALAEVMAGAETMLSSTVIDEVVARSAGNPLFLGELLASIDAGVVALPDSLEGLILSRLDALPVADSSALRRLSVLGAEFPRSMAPVVLGSETPADDRLWHRLRDFVVVSADGSVQFTHTLTMEGAYNSLPFRVRERLHARVGEAIEKRAGSRAEEEPEALSLHFFHARQYAKAWRYARSAASRAQSVYANVEAARFLERAIEAGRRGQCASAAELLVAYEALGDVHKRVGLIEQASASYDAARRLADGDPVTVARLFVKQAGLRQRQGAFAQARRWLGKAEKALAGGGQASVRPRAEIAVARASIAKDQNQPTEVVRWCQHALELASEPHSRDVRAHAAFLLDHGWIRLGRPDLAVNAQVALRLYEELGDLVGQGAVLNNLGGYAYWAGRWDEAVELYERARQAFERVGDVAHTAITLVNVGEIRSDQGRVDEAADLFNRSLAIRRRMGDRASVVYVTSNMGRLATRTEKFDDARQLLRTARDLAHSLALPADVVEADLRLVECFCHAGEASAALALADDLRSRVEAGSIQMAMLSRLEGYAALQLGRLDAARNRLTESLRAGRSAAAPFEVGLTLRALAYLDGAFGADPLPRLVEAEAILTPLGVIAVDEPVTLSFAPRPRAVIPAQQDAGSAQPSLPT